MPATEPAAQTAADALAEHTLLGPATDPATPADDDSLTVALADDLTLRVTGRPESEDRPFALAFAYDPAPGERRPREHVMLSEAFGTAELESNTARNRLATTLFGVYPGDGDREDIADQLTEALDDLRERYAAGELLVLDDVAKKLIGETTRVEYRPERGQWHVGFGTGDPDPRGGGTSSATFGSRVWADPDPGANAGSEISTLISAHPFHNHPERWRVCRGLWQRMASDVPIDDTDSDA